MKMSRKIMCLLGSSLLIVALAGCGTTERTQPQDSQQEDQQSGDEQGQAGQQPGDGQGQESQQPGDGQGQESQQPGDGQGQESQQSEEQQPADSQGQETQASAEDTEQLPGDIGQAGENTSVRIWGPILRVEDGNVVIDNRSEVSFRGEMVVTVDPEHTRILDGENGYPVEVSELNEGEAVFVYIGPAATMSEPPMVNASLILCKIPSDLRVPDYVHVTAMEEQSDGSYLLSGDNGIQYLVPADCEILPFLTRNVVTLQDVQAGGSCLIWSDERRTAQKIVLFAE